MRPFVGLAALYPLRRLWLAFLLLASSRGEGACPPLPLSALERRPAAEESADFWLFGGWAGEVYARLLVPRRQAASPAEVEVRLYRQGKPLETRHLWLGGQLTTGFLGGKGQDEGRPLWAVAVSADGQLVAVRGVDRAWVFRGDQVVAKLEGLFFFGSLVLTEDLLLYAPMADGEEERVLLYGYPLELKGKPRVLLERGKNDKGLRQLLPAPRTDGKLFAVDAFTLEVMLLRENGTVLRRWAAPEAPFPPAQDEAQSLSELERERAQVLADATKKPPQVKVTPGASERAFQVAAVGKELVVAAHNQAWDDSEHKRLFYLQASTDRWRCWQVPFAGVYALIPEGKGLRLTLVSGEKWFLPLDVLATPSAQEEESPAQETAKAPPGDRL